MRGIVDEIGYLPVIAGGGNLFFQLVNARTTKALLSLPLNRGFAEWGEVFGDHVVATSSMGSFITPSSSRSRVQVIGSVSTSTSYPSKSAQISQLHRSHLSSAVIGHPNTEVLIIQTANRRPAKWG